LSLCTSIIPVLFFEIVLLYTRKKASSLKQADCRDMFRKLFKNICTSVIVVSAGHVCPTTSTFAVKTEKTEVHGDPELAEEGSIPMEYSCGCTAQV
jgi:hypothetical protein